MIAWIAVLLVSVPVAAILPSSAGMVLRVAWALLLPTALTSVAATGCWLAVWRGRKDPSAYRAAVDEIISAEANRDPQDKVVRLQDRAWAAIDHGLVSAWWDPFPSRRPPFALLAISLGSTAGWVAVCALIG